MEHLLPSDWFNGLPWSALLVTTAISILVLSKGADWLVEGASGFAYRFGMPKVIVGATIVSLGTTAPECAVSVMGALQGNSGLALGNAVGSVIADTGLIFGVGCLMTVLPADRFVLNRQGWVQFTSGLILVILCYYAFALNGDQAEITRPMGIGFLCGLGLYLYQSVKWARQHPHGEPFIAPEGFDETTLELVEESRATTKEQGLVALCVLMAVGLVFVLVGARVLIGSVEELAQQIGVPDVVVSSTIVAFGTSLPELVVGIQAILKKHPELLVGNVIGADILNILFVIGAAATAIPLPLVDPTARIPAIFLYMHLPTMLAILVLFRIYIFSASKRGRFRRSFGIPLVLIYVLFVVLQYLLG